MASCSCCGDPEPGEFRLITMLVIGLALTGVAVLVWPFVGDVAGDVLTWLRQQDLIVPAEDAALRLPGDIGLSWRTLAVGFAVIVVLGWLLSQLLRALGLSSK